MHPKVRDLYKRFLIAGRTYPQGLSYVREKVKHAFQSSSSQLSEEELNKAIAKGRYWVRELHAISALHKYRQMNKRYGNISVPHIEDVISNNDNKDNKDNKQHKDDSNDASHGTQKKVE